MAPKKPLPKKTPTRIPRIPKDAQVKVIEIGPRTFIIPLLAIALGWALWTIWSQNSNETITYNDKIGLNEIRQNYQSGSYEEIVISGHEVTARKQAVKNVVAGKEISKRNIDRTNLPINVAITDIGLSDPANPTKVTIKDNDWSNALWEFIPSILLTVLFVLLLIFMMGRMG